MEAGAADKSKAGADFVLQDLEHPRDPRIPRGSQPIEVKTADGDRVGAERDRLDDVGAAIKAAIDDDLRPAAHRLSYLRQDVERAAHVVELPSAVIGDVDAVDAVIDRDRRILAGLDAFEDQRQLVAVLILEALDLGPGE